MSSLLKVIAFCRLFPLALALAPGAQSAFAAEDGVCEPAALFFLGTSMFISLSRDQVFFFDCVALALVHTAGIPQEGGGVLLVERYDRLIGGGGAYSFPTVGEILQSQALAVLIALRRDTALTLRPPHEGTPNVPCCIIKITLPWDDCSEPISSKMNGSVAVDFFFLSFSFCVEKISF